MPETLLSVHDLSISFLAENGRSTVVENITYSLNKNEIRGIVGESGSGKSVSSLAILGLLPKKVSKIETGEILLNGFNLITASKEKLQSLRGKEISIIFQEPMSSLNPSLRCGEQVTEILLQHTNLSKKEAKEETISLFKKVKLPRPDSIFESYPHQISGGQKQRVMIAMAIACKPKILIADEPTTALDVTVQQDIILLLKQLQQETGMSIIFISHDLTMVSEIADKVAVMYKGRIVEQGLTKDIFKSPQHNYTKALLNSRPPLDKRLKKLMTIKDFLDNSFTTEVISEKEREQKHQKLYSKPPLLEIINVEKEYFSNASFFGKTTSVKAVDNVSFKVYEGE